MIVRKRFEELIKQGAVVYDLFEGDVELIDLTEAKVLGGAENIVAISYDNSIYGKIIRDNKDLFETKEQAEWKRKFGCIERTETLKLPTWEEFCNENKLVAFTAYPHNYHLLKVGNYIYLRSFYKQSGMDIFNKPATKENYIEACRLCKKLFLGKEV